MDRQPWRSRVAAELARRGVPAHFRARLLRELQDHADDLTDEGIDMTDETLDARLGTPEQVAATAADQYRRAGWVRRHPLLTFGLAPVPLAFGCLVLYFLGMAAVGVGFHLCGADADSWPRATVHAAADAFNLGVRFAPFALAGWWVGRLAARHGLGRTWGVVGLVQVAAFAGLFVSGVVHSDEPGRSYWYLGFCLRAPAAGFDPEWAALFLPATWAQLPQALTPVGAAALAAWRVRRRDARMA